ncbi:unnamed protein product [Closterium sp. NIES-54]
MDAQREERDVIITRLEGEKAEMVGELMDVIVEAVAAAGAASAAGNLVTEAAPDDWKVSAPVMEVSPAELLGVAAALEPVLTDVAPVNEASAVVGAFAAVAAVGDVAGREITTAQVEWGGKDVERVDAEMLGDSNGGWEESRPEAAAGRGETLIATSASIGTVAATVPAAGTTAITTVTVESISGSRRRYSTVAAAGWGRSRGGDSCRGGGSGRGSGCGSMSWRASEGEWGKAGESKVRDSIPKGKVRVVRDRDLPTRRHTVLSCTLPCSPLPCSFPPSHLHPSHCRASLPVGHESTEGREGDGRGRRGTGGHQTWREGVRMGQGGEEGEGEGEGYAWQAFRALIDGGAMPGDYNEASGVEARRDSTGTAGDFIRGDIVTGDSIEGDSSEVDVMQRRRRMSAGRRRWWDRGVMERVRAWEWRGGRQRGAGREGGRAEEGAGDGEIGERQVEQREEEQREWDMGVEWRGGGEQGRWEVSEPAARGSYRRGADVGEARGFLGDEVWSEHALGGGMVEGEEVSARGRVIRMLGDDKENVEPAIGLEI